MGRTLFVVESSGAPAPEGCGEPCTSYEVGGTRYDVYAPAGAKPRLYALGFDMAGDCALLNAPYPDLSLYAPAVWDGFRDGLSFFDGMRAKAAPAQRLVEY